MARHGQLWQGAGACGALGQGWSLPKAGGGCVGTACPSPGLQSGEGVITGTEREPGSAARGVQSSFPSLPGPGAPQHGCQASKPFWCSQAMFSSASLHPPPPPAPCFALQTKPTAFPSRCLPANQGWQWLCGDRHTQTLRGERALLRQELCSFGFGVVAFWGKLSPVRGSLAPQEVMPGGARR